jgi:hypothetical protein
MSFTYTDGVFPHAPMQRFHVPSFFYGLLSGVIVLVIVAAGMRFLPASSTASSAGTGTQNIARMAQRFGMTEAELQKELDSGKTFQQIAQEHNVQLGGRGFRGSGASSAATGSGAVTGSGTAVRPSSFTATGAVQRTGTGAGISHSSAISSVTVH